MRDILLAALFGFLVTFVPIAVVALGVMALEYRRHRRWMRGLGQ